jgi:DNA repair protein RadA/Sms
MGVNGQGILLLAETDVDLILERLDETKPALAIIDSIQTLQSESETSGPGSVGQVRESALRLLRWAKTAGRPVFLSGHMTKDGALAGPRVLEHMVDVVLHLESQESGGFRVLRAAKNRFGSTDEVGVFQMTERGMADVSDPSRAMLSQKDGPQLGAIVTPVLEGSRALLLEVQALTNFSQLPAPRRVANGVDHNRLLMLTAVASRRTGLELGGQDVIVNVAGGFRATEPAADLAIILAIASCYRNAPLPPAAAFGEVGLSAELRAVPQAQRRVNEAARLGLTRCILPSACLPEVEAPPGMRLTGAETVGHAIRAALTSPADDADIVLAGGRARAVSAASSR